MAQRQRRPGTGDLIHVATANPVSLYTMDPRQRHLTSLDLYDLFPSHRGSYSRPRLHVAPLGAPLDSTVLLHEGLVRMHPCTNQWASHRCAMIGCLKPGPVHGRNEGKQASLRAALFTVHIDL